MLEDDPLPELDALKRKLAAREKRGGFGLNTEALKQRIADLEKAGN